MPQPVRRRAPGWYLRLLVLTLVVLVGVPAVAGAVWLTSTPSGSAGPATRRAAAPVAPGARASGSGTRGSTSVQGSGGVGPGGPDQSVLKALFDRRGSAVASHDASAWEATVDASVPSLLDGQRALYERISALGATSWRYSVSAPDVALSQERRDQLGVPAFLAHVALTYRLARGVPEIRRDQHVTVVWRGRWLVGGTEDGPQQRDVWDLGPVTVQRGTRTVVVAAQKSPVPAARTAGEADGAAGRVDAVWGTSWPRTSVVQVPATLEDMAALLGRSDTDGLSQLAAVTTGEPRTSGTDAAGTASGPDNAGNASSAASTAGAAPDASGDLVVLNPQAFSGLTATGRTAVLTHELTHVATRAGTRVAPPVWVDEGFADYVAYLDTPLTARDVAADVLTSPARLAALKALPPDSAFDPAAGDVGPAYSEAWLAMRYVESQGGTPMVVDFYRVASSLPPLRSWPRPSPVRAALTPRTPLEHACYDVVGYLQPSFVRRWVVYVKALAATA